VTAKRAISQLKAATDEGSIARERNIFLFHIMPRQARAKMEIAPDRINALALMQNRPISET